MMPAALGACARAARFIGHPFRQSPACGWV
jgi:hypothetical protein